MNWLKRLWCDWTHGGGRITRDINGCINWQCIKCGRWAVGVDKATEDYVINKSIEAAERRA